MARDVDDVVLGRLREQHVRGGIAVAQHDALSTRGGPSLTDSPRLDRGERGQVVDGAHRQHGRIRPTDAVRRIRSTPHRRGSGESRTAGSGAAGRRAAHRTAPPRSPVGDEGQRPRLRKLRGERFEEARVEFAEHVDRGLPHEVDVAGDHVRVFESPPLDDQLTEQLFDPRRLAHLADDLACPTRRRRTRSPRGRSPGSRRPVRRTGDRIAEHRNGSRPAVGAGADPPVVRDDGPGRSVPRPSAHGRRATGRRSPAARPAPQRRRRSDDSPSIASTSPRPCIESASSNARSTSPASRSRSIMSSAADATCAVEAAGVTGRCRWSSGSRRATAAARSKSTRAPFIDHRLVGPTVRRGDAAAT